VKRALARQARQEAGAHIGKGRLQLERRNDEYDGDHTEERNPILDQPEGAFPQHQPGEQSYRHGPPSKTDSRNQLEGQTHASDLGS
jgi:hypothetical protein